VLIAIVLRGKIRATIHYRKGKGYIMARLPGITIKEVRELLISLKSEICDDCRIADDEDLPGMVVTIGYSTDGDWNYQTGDNSFSGGAYGHPHWAVVYLYRRSNSLELARDVIDQLWDMI
jgi:hypothetical protein